MRFVTQVAESLAYGGHSKQPFNNYTVLAIQATPMPSKNVHRCEHRRADLRSAWISHPWVTEEPEDVPACSILPHYPACARITTGSK